MIRPFVACAVAGVVAGACAQQGIPPGGPEDTRPPVVVQTFPEALGILTELDAPVRFFFDERISERMAGGTLESAVTVSPRGGEVRVSHGSRSLTVRTEGGFRPGLVYRVTLKAVVSDMFNNRMTDPFELVFTTGGETPSATTLAGEVWDRIDGNAVNEAVILAEAADGLIHQATADRDGIYAFRYLPDGQYRVTAFEDQNRNGDADSTEVQGRFTADLAAGDTLLLDLPILAPDTAAAVVAGASPLDSVTVAVLFDDYLDPTVEAGAFDVTISSAEASAPSIVRVFQEAEYEAYIEEVADSLIRADSIAAAEAAAVGPVETAPDSVPPADSTEVTEALPGVVAAGPDSAAAADTVRLGRVGAPTPPGAAGAAVGRKPPPGLERLQGPRAGPTQDGRRVLPGRRIVLLLSEALLYDVEYEVQVSGVVNIAGLGGGGGVASLVLEAPPADTMVVDTTAAPDSAAIDTLAVPDSAVLPDTGVAGPGPPGGDARR
ncbi:MAG: Ig-like domain-containing protein [Gemmatimonadota bacterium]|nr:Ig-like domain-containing protein [Gemmatimonadota bacterium]